MMDDNFDPGPWRPRIPGTTELNLGDEWRAFWMDEGPLPEDVPVTYAYGLVYRGDKGYVVRPRGSREPWSTIEGAPDGEKDPEDYLRQIARERSGARIARTILIGYLECRATSHNPDYPAGAITVRPAYTLVAETVDDVPEESGYERRRLSLSEHGIAIRNRYPEFQRHFNRAAQEYAVMLARGEALA